MSVIFPPTIRGLEDGCANFMGTWDFLSAEKPPCPENSRFRGELCFLGGKVAYLQLECFLLTVELLCLQSVEVLLRHTFPL